MNCHTLLGNGAYYAPDLTKNLSLILCGIHIWRMGKLQKEEAIAEFYNIHLIIHQMKE